MPLLGKLKIVGRTPEALSPRRTNAGAIATRTPSFHSVYRQYFDFVWSTARRLGVPPEALDDLVQEVFIVIHTKLGTLEKPESLRSWIYSVVKRSVSSHRRTERTRSSARLAGGASEEVASSAPTPLEQTQTNADMQLLVQLLQELEEPKREVFALVELQELSVPEVAELLEIPLNTAYSRLRAARQAFEAALARYEARTRER